MIFDERDLEEELNEEDMKKNHKPQKNQIKIDDIINQEKSSKRTNSKQKEKTLSSKENNDKQEISVKTPREEDVKNLQNKKSIKNQEIDNLMNLNIEQQDEQVVEEKTFENSLVQDDYGNYLKDISRIYHDSMIPYSEYVILDRAIPRVEDGLKPVQRRILYSMWELGVTPDKPYKKSAKTVGDVIANYHPHGDSSIYNAMVHMAQKFNMREILIDGHGNFGSVDGDGPAAMRYTEARLAPLSLEMLRDIDKNTVRWSKNYDDSKDEPEMLPSRFPNILVNGATGIAVGLATNIPPHNLGECIDACASVIDNPNITTEELMQVVKGPDFPTGGLILGNEGLKQAYETGKGRVIVRAKTQIEQEKGDKQVIVITEFPYQVNKSQVLYKIAELKEKYKDILSGIGEIRDESDRQGIRAVLYLKKDADAQTILNFLYKYTDLQTSIGINMVAIANGKPRQMGLKEILTYYVKYQQDVILRRTKYDLEAAQERANIVEGLLIAIKNIDEVIKVIKTSASTVEAKINLCEKFALNEKQAQAILDMRLARLTNLEVYKLEEELEQLKKLIKELQAIINSDKLQMSLVKKEMLEIKKKHATKRQTVILTDSSDFKIDDKLTSLKPVKDVYIAVNERNCIKKMPEKSFMSSSKSASENSSLNEMHSLILKTKTNMNILLFTKLGLCYKISQEDILEARWKDRGSSLHDIIHDFNDNDRVVAIFDYKNQIPKQEIVFITNLGNVKRVGLADYDVNKQTISALKLKENETVINVEMFNKDKTMLFVSTDGMVLNANIQDVPVTSRTSGLVKGMSLNENQFVIGGGLVNKDSLVCVITDKGFAKKVKIEEFGELARNRKGVKVISLTKDNGNSLIYASIIKNTFEVVVFDEKDKQFSISTDDINLESRITKGKIINKLLKDKNIKKAVKYSWN